MPSKKKTDETTPETTDTAAAAPDGSADASDASDETARAADPSPPDATPSSIPDASLPASPVGVIELGDPVEDGERASWILEANGHPWARLVASARGLELEAIPEGAPLAAAAPVDPYAGATVMELHLSGAAWNNNERKLVRVSPNDEDWMVQIGDVLVCSNGQTIPAKPFRHIASALQPRVRFPLDKAIQLAQTHQ